MNQNKFRIALSLGQGIEDYFKDGVVYRYGDMEAKNLQELEKLYLDAGATEMYVRIATKRYDDGDTSIDGYHAALHNLEKSLEMCRIAAEMNVPINPEIMCAYTYMDGFEQQAPDFKDYPEITKPQKTWDEYSLNEMCDVLEQYGEFVAKEVISTGCEVNYWNLGNEANFGFAGVSLGLKTAVNPIIQAKNLYEMYGMEHIGADWLKENIWKYNGKLLLALANGIKKVDTSAKFSTHVACQNDVYFNTLYFNTLMENGYQLDHAGISIYPTNEAASYFSNYMEDMKEVIRAINEHCGLQVFIAEYGYPSSVMAGPYEKWSVPVDGYELNEEDQARFTLDFIKWGKENGVCGIRPWAPDFIGHWGPMSLFSYDEKSKVASAKSILDVFKINNLLSAV